MLIDLYMFDHNVLHICFWTLPAIIIGVVMVIMAVWHNRNQKKREKEFEEEMGKAPVENLDSAANAQA